MIYKPQPNSFSIWKYNKSQTVTIYYLSLCNKCNDHKIVSSLLAKKNYSLELFMNTHLCFKSPFRKVTPRTLENVGWILIKVIGGQKGGQCVENLDLV